MQNNKLYATAHNCQTLPGTNLPYIVHIANVTIGFYRITAVNFSFPIHSYIHVTCLVEFHSYGINLLTFLNHFLILILVIISNLSQLFFFQQTYEIWIVKMADRITNLQPPPKHWTKQKIENYRQEAKLIHNNLKDAGEYLSERLLNKISEYHK